MTQDGGRAELDGLEGMHARELLGKEMYELVKSKMDGKVVLIDFWGTWSHTCLHVRSRLAELLVDYRPQGFELISIHSRRGLPALDKFLIDEYLKKRPQWTNLRDETGQLANSFNVRTIHISICSTAEASFESHNRIA